MDDSATLDPAGDHPQPVRERSTGESLMLVGLLAAIIIPLAGLGVTAAKILIFKLGIYRPDDWNLAAFGDFDAFVVAAQLLQAGRYACLYAIECVGQAQAAYSGLPVLDIRMTWNYPPTMDLLILPAAAVPPNVTYAILLAANLAMIAWLVRQLRPTHPVPGLEDPALARYLGWLPAVLFAFSPSTVTGAAIGQTGILIATLAFTGLRALPTAPFRAGCILGLLAIKPHLALILPFVALGQRKPKDAGALIAGAATTIAVLTAGSLLVYGAEPWIAFFHGLGNTRDLFIGGGYSRTLMMAAYVTLVAAGVPEPLALATQALIGLGVGIAILLVWRSQTLSRTTQVALTLMALPLASPYIYYYDFACWFFGLALLIKAALSRGAIGFAFLLTAPVSIPWYGTLANLWMPFAKRADWPFQPVGILMIATFAALLYAQRADHKSQRI